MPPITHFRISFILLALTSLLLVQCGFGESEPEPAQPVELSWITWQQDSAVEIELIKRYRADRPQVTFRRQSAPPGQAQIDSDPPPDIVNVLVNYEFLQAIKEGSYADLTQIWTDTGLDSAIPQSFQQMTAHEAKQYLVPAAFDWTGVYFNKAVFAQYQLQPPQDWDDLVQLCDTLLINGEIPFAISAQGFTIRLWFDYLVLRVGGRQFYQELLDGKASYEDSRVQEALERWRALIEQGCFVEKPGQYDDQDAIQMLVRSDNGMLGRTKAAMMLVDAFTFTQMPVKFRDEMDFFRFPQISPDVPLTELVAVTGYTIPAKSTHSSQALEFLTFMASKESQQTFTQEIFVSSALLAPMRNDLASEAMSSDMQKAIQSVNESEAVAPLSFIWLPTEMVARTELAFRQLTSDVINGGWDFPGFVEILEEARQSALESGLLSKE